jgi:hypothetical protein
MGKFWGPFDRVLLVFSAACAFGCVYYGRAAYFDTHPVDKVAATPSVDVQSMNPAWWPAIGLGGSALALCIIGVIGLLLHKKKNDHKLRPAMSDRAEAPSVTRDIDLQDAAYFVVCGRWLGEHEPVTLNVDQGLEANRILTRMRELAGESKLLIWGRSSPARLHEPIPAAYWIDHQIDSLTALFKAKNGKTEAAAHGASSLIFHDLMVSKHQIESAFGKAANSGGNPGASITLIGGTYSAGNGGVGDADGGDFIISAGNGG